MASERATASCYCGTVQISFSTADGDILGTFICHCSDCKKITASVFASGFIIRDSALTHTRGKERLAQYTRQAGIDSGNTVTNHFCRICGSLMYRRSSGFPGTTVPRMGTVDDVRLLETKLKPAIEQFSKDRVSWLHAAEGAEVVDGNFFTGGK